MRLLSKKYLLGLLLLNIGIVGCGGNSGTTANKQVGIEVFHADSLAGPMSQLKKAFEANNPTITVNLTSSRSKELAERILAGDVCDVFAPSDPAVMKSMVGKIVNGKESTPWYITFSANEMVVITKKGNPLGIKQMTDLTKDGVKFTRVAGEKDIATVRTVQFIKNATSLEGKPELAAKIIDDGTKVSSASIPDVVQAIKDNKADASIVYLSAAVAAGNDVEIVYFPANVNLSGDIRNVANVPSTAKNVEAANAFIKFIISPDGQQILKNSGQPPVIPPAKDGPVPASILQ